jgi:hypothetical protein
MLSLLFLPSKSEIDRERDPVFKGIRKTKETHVIAERTWSVGLSRHVVADILAPKKGNCVQK